MEYINKDTLLDKIENLPRTSIPSAPIGYLKEVVYLEDVLHAIRSTPDFKPLPICPSGRRFISNSD